MHAISISMVPPFLVSVSFEDFIIRFNKTYKDKEEKRIRNANYQMTVIRLERFNRIFCDGNSSVYNDVTRLSDQTFDEIGANYTGGGSLGEDT